jgi:hypothetical protein
MDNISIELLYEIFLILNRPLLLSIRKTCKLISSVARMLPLQFHTFENSDIDFPVKKYLFRRFRISIQNVKNTYIQHLIDTKTNYHFHSKLPRRIHQLTLDNTHNDRFIQFLKYNSEINNVIALKIVSYMGLQNFPPSVKYLNIEQFTFSTSKHNFPLGLEYLRCMTVSPNGNYLKNLTKLKKLHVSQYSSFGGYIDYPESLRYFTINLLTSKLEQLPNNLTHLTIKASHREKFLLLPNIPNSLHHISIPKLIVSKQQHITGLTHITVAILSEAIPNKIIKLDIRGYNNYYDFTVFNELKILIITTINLDKLILPNLIELCISSEFTGDVITVKTLPNTIKYLSLNTPQNITFTCDQLSLKTLFFKCVNIDLLFFITATLEYICLQEVSEVAIQLPHTLKIIILGKQINLIQNLRTFSQLSKLVLPCDTSLFGIKLPRSLRYLKTNKNNLHLIPRWVTDVVIY